MTSRLPYTAHTTLWRYGASIHYPANTRVILAVLTGLIAVGVHAASPIAPEPIPATLADPWIQQTKLTAQDGLENDEFGFSVARSSDTALVAARSADVAGSTDQGKVYVFTNDGMGWNAQAELWAEDGGAGDLFGSSVALSDDATTAIVGAWRADVNGRTDQGAAYVFTRTGDTWSQQAKLTADDGDEEERFGSWVAFSDETILIGAVEARPDGDFARGAAYVFTRTEGGWAQQAKLVASDGEAFDQFGWAVALEGDTAVISAPSDDGLQGSAYVFVRTEGSWTQQAKLVGDLGNSEFFGESVAISGDMVLVGAGTSTIDGNLDQGAAYIFRRSIDGWEQEARLTAADGAAFDVFGIHVALVEDMSLVAAMGDAEWQGSVYVFKYDGTAWNQVQKIVADDGAHGDFFGRSIAVSDNSAIIGAVLDDTKVGQNRGSAYVFEMSTVAELEINPSSLDFGETEIGTTGGPLTATLTNTGTVEATGLAFDLADGAFMADTGNCGDTLPGGGSCAVDVTFTPVEAGLATASLEVMSDGEATASLPLAGSGVAESAFTPMALEVDPEPFLSDGNGVFEPNELIEVMPTWRNDGILATSVVGTATDFNGMDGALYALAMDAADYGLVEPTAEASCRELGVCYWLAVNEPAARPATHWTAELDETLSDPDGTTQTWQLHIGDSFTDVPRSSPFYDAIETMLHHEVTGGCTENAYCPAGTNTRGQMAVFLLKAAEGGDYTPPACVESDPRFADVPFNSPLCPWIQDLAERGVTSGCGNGNYCPSAPVTRAQMAIFLLKALEGEGYTPPECTGTFTDVTCPSPFAAWVEELASREVADGCSASPPAYCPAAPVTRAQMAVFVTKTFGLTLYGP